MLLPLLLACSGGDPPASSAPPPDCGDGELYDGEACVPETCGMAPWGDAEGTIYVDIDAEDGGDGSRDAPLRDLAQAVEDAGNDDVIVIADGTYAVTLDVEKRDLVLVGRCEELVVLDGADGAKDSSVIRFNAGRSGRDDQLQLRDLTLRSGRSFGLWLGGGVVELEGVTVEDSQDGNVVVEGGQASLTDIALLDPQPLGPASDAFGANLIVAGDAQVTARQLLARGGQVVSVLVTGGGGAHLVLEDSEIRDLAPEDRDGWAMVVERASAELRDVRIQDIDGFGLEAHTASLSLEGVHIDGVRGPGYAIPVSGVGSMTGAEVTARDVLIENSAGGFVVFESGSTMELSDVVVRDAAPGSLGVGLHAWSGGRLEVDGFEVTGGANAGLLALYGGELTAKNGVVAHTAAGYSSINGSQSPVFSVWVGSQSSATLTDVEIGPGHGTGVMGNNTEGGVPEVTLTDVRIHGLEREPMTRSAIGVYMTGASLRAERLVIEDIAGPGIAAATLGSPDPTDVHCIDCEISRVQLAGAVASGSATGTHMTLERPTISGVSLDESTSLGIGMLFTHDDGPPTVQVTGAAVTDTAHGALFVVGEGSVEVHDSTLEGGAGVSLAGGLDVHGNAVYATGGVGPWDGTTGLHLTGNQFIDGSGTTVLLHDASASLSGNDWGDAGVLQQQRCGNAAALAEGHEAPVFSECPDLEQPVQTIETAPIDRAPIEL